MAGRKTYRLWTELIAKVSPPKVGRGWVVAAIVWTLLASYLGARLDPLAGFFMLLGNTLVFLATKAAIEHGRVQFFDGRIVDDSQPEFWRAIRNVMLASLVVLNFYLVNYLWPGMFTMNVNVRWYSSPPHPH